MRVGIIGAGAIAAVMADTLSKMTRAEAYAIASRDLAKAEQFAKVHKVKCSYGSYEEMLKDKKVDLVYIATPHTFHYEQARMCINYGKPVLVEKPFCVTVKETEELLAYAKERDVFITEAIWTRYMPMVEEIKNALTAGVIGEPKMLTANLGYALMHKTRVVSPELAGGALLDVGIYPLNFAAMLFGHDVVKTEAVCTFTETGVDANDGIVLTYGDGKMAVINSSMVAVSDRLGIIQGDKGYMIVENVNNFEGFTVYDNSHKKISSKKRPKQISGYEYEVEACRVALSKKQLSCPQMPHEETIRMMKQMEQIRRICKIKYPFEN
ncbi:MAG: Gfo/Idh/MocA family oxidoreductase [Lachnospiraceae bacterium]|nr:Gfo/Idh/MocA family oxidoreductase [Lachnospiraceae bacterium]